MSAAAVLPIIQARAEFVPILKRLQAEREAAAAAEASAAEEPVPIQPPARPAPRPQLAFYRKYTEALLRRYMRMSLEVGRVPSILGREMFRAKVSSYRMESFEDAVIFCHDVERCIQRLTASEQTMIEHLALKQYTAVEAEPVLHLCRQTIVRQYTRALDRLTLIFLEVEILNPAKCCQAPRAVENSPSESN